MKVLSTTALLVNTMNGPPTMFFLILCNKSLRSSVKRKSFASVGLCRQTLAKLAKVQRSFHNSNLYFVVKGSHFLHCLQSGINIFVVTPTQEFFKWIHMFLFRYFLQVLIILSSWMRPFWRVQNGNIVLGCHSIFYQIDVFTVFCFKRITITQNLAKCAQRGKFCVLLFLVVFERFFLGETFLFLMFCMLSRKNPDYSLHRENSWYPRFDCHRTWRRCIS